MLSDYDSNELPRSTPLIMLLIRAARETLLERKADMLILRYGLLDGQSRTLAQIGEQYGVTRERVRQLLQKGLNQLRRCAISQTRRGGINAPCAALATYIREAVLPNEQGEDVRLRDLLTSDLPHLKLVSEAAPLVSSFLGSQEVVARYVTMIRDLTEEQKVTRREDQKRQRVQEKFETLLQHVIWPPNIRLVGPDEFGQYSPARAIRPTTGIETGTYYSDRMGRTIEYESGIERDFLRRLEAVDQVVFYQEQPFRIAYRTEDTTHNYYPDIFFILSSGRAIVIEITPPFDMAQKENWTKWGALRAFCRENGYGLMVTDGRHTIQSLSRCPVRPDMRASLLRTLAEGPMTWPDYKTWRDDWGVSTEELYAVIIRERLTWRTRPFLLSR